MTKKAPTFAEKLVALRDAAGLTQDALIAKSKKLGVAISKRSYSEWETGVRPPTMSSMAKIAKVLGLQVKDLL